MVKIESISPKIRNKTSVPTLTTNIQHSFEIHNHNNQRIKRNNGIQIRKEVEFSLFAYDKLLILYVENPKDATKKTTRAHQ